MRSLRCVATVMLALPTAALACSPVPPDPERDAGRAGHVLLVRVKAVQAGRFSVLDPAHQLGDRPARIASYQMETALKGEAPADRRFAVELPPPMPVRANGIPDPVWCGDWPLPRTGERWLLYRQDEPFPHTQAVALQSPEGQLHWQWWQTQQRHTAKP